MTPCECGCGREARPGSKYHDYERCRQRAYRNKVKTEAERAGLPAHLNLQVATSAQARNGDAQTSARSRQTRRRAPDLRIPYGRLLERLEEFLEQCTDCPAPHTTARQLLHPLLTDRQRAHLTGRTS